MSIADPLPKSAVLVVNAHSRKGRRLYRRACRKLRDAGLTLTAAHAVRKPAEIPSIVNAAVDGGARMVIVGGGDGTLSCAVDVCANRNVVFAILPLGTANSTARSLGLPLDLDGAVAVIAGGRRKRIDLGMIDCDYYANCAAMGISPLIAETVPHGLKKVLGRAGYLGWAAFQLTRFRPFKLTVRNGDEVHRLEALEVRIANGPYHGGTELVDEAALDSGEIVVQAVVGHARSTLLWSWAASVLRIDARHRTTREFRGRELRIETDPPLSISIDGEVLARTPVTARVASGALTIAAPKR